MHATLDYINIHADKNKNTRINMYPCTYVYMHLVIRELANHRDGSAFPLLDKAACGSQQRIRVLKRAIRCPRGGQPDAYPHRLVGDYVLAYIYALCVCVYVCMYVCVLHLVLKFCFSILSLF